MGRVRTLHVTILWVLAAGLLFAGPALAGEATPDDTARFLAGMKVNENSPLEPLARDKVFAQHAELFDRAWSTLETAQLSKVKAWSDENLRSPQRTLFYMFSGPDFLYANAFFPKASTYVMSGLELPGNLPDVASIPKGMLPYELAGLRGSLSSVLNLSFFITNEMSRRLYGRRLTGILPVLYVFLARSGKTITDVSFVTLNKEGRAVNDKPAGPGSQSKAKSAPGAEGIKITFLAEDGRPQTLYYFRTDLSNHGTSESGFLKFCETLGAGDSFIKSASYLPHSAVFSNVRNFLLERSATILEDDTGVPLKSFDMQDWDLKPFGNYVKPIPIFRGLYQPNLHAFFVSQKAKPLEFGIGYQKRPNISSLLLAMKKPGAVGQASTSLPIQTGTR